MYFATPKMSDIIGKLVMHLAFTTIYYYYASSHSIMQYLANDILFKKRPKPFPHKTFYLTLISFSSHNDQMQGIRGKPQSTFAL